MPLNLIRIEGKKPAILEGSSPNRVFEFEFEFKILPTVVRNQQALSQVSCFHTLHFETVLSLSKASYNREYFENIRKTALKLKQIVLRAIRR